MTIILVQGGPKKVGPTLQDQQLVYRMIPYYGNPLGWLPLHQHSNMGEFYDTLPTFTIYSMIL